MKSIIIPIYNQHEITQECISAVLDNTTDFELVLVDNGSENPLDFLHLPEVDAAMNEFGEAWGEPIKTNIGGHPAIVIMNRENLGFPAAVNQGIKAATGETIILLNNDVIVTPAWADLLETAMVDFDIVGPMTNYCAGIQRTTIGAYNDVDELAVKASLYSTKHINNFQPVSFVIGFCMAFKRSLVDEIGLFDDSLWPCSGEEIDFCFRAEKAGKSLAVVKGCYVHHEGSQTFQAMQEAGEVDYLNIVSRNDKHLAEKWGADFWLRQVA